MFDLPALPVYPAYHMKPMLRIAAALCWVLLAGVACGESDINLATLNCYWFFDAQEGKGDIDKPRTTLEYSTKAGHLIGLLPKEAPLFVGFQEIGGGEDLAALAHSASARYGRAYQTLFARGKDTATGQNVGAILDTSSGWGVYGRALLKWAMRHLSGDPKANLVILGDFNEGKPVGSDSQALEAIFQAKPPMVDALGTLSGKITTHTDGKAYDRILVSDAISKGLNRLKLEGVVIQQHRHGKGEERRLYTDHFPVGAELRGR